MNFQMFKMDLEKAEEQEFKLPTSIGSSKKQANNKKKHIYFCFIDYAKAFDCVDHNKLKNSSRNRNTRPPDLPSEKICIQVKNQHLELDMEQQTGSKLRKEYINTVYCHAYLTYIQSISCKMLGWMKHKLESRLLEEVQ